MTKKEVKAVAFYSSIILLALLITRLLRTFVSPNYHVVYNFIILIIPAVLLLYVLSKNNYTRK
jgi:TctA family transporter